MNHRKERAEKRLQELEMTLPPGLTYAMFVEGRLRATGTGAELILKLRKHWGRYDNSKIHFLPAQGAIEFLL
jgi:hypothetical protein